MVMRDAVEEYIELEGPPKTIDTVREAVSYLAPAMNTLSFTRGYTPSQWVLNTNPRGPSSITTDDFNPVAHKDALEDDDFASMLDKRQSARVAFIRADADARLRRALLRRHRAIKTPLVVGQLCFYWREAGAPRLQTIDGEDQPESSCEKATTNPEDPCVTGSYTVRPSFEPHQSMYDQA
jgi:hypothetical protein